MALTADPAATATPLPLYLVVQRRGRAIVIIWVNDLTRIFPGADPGLSDLRSLTALIGERLSKFAPS
jgi:hypothetical protein